MTDSQHQDERLLLQPANSLALFSKLLHNSLLSRYRHQRTRQVVDQSLDLLSWGRKFLPEHFVLPPSQMHLWLADELDRMHRRRGTKLNVLGPRAGAKSTLASLCYVLRAAVEAREPYIWIVSDTKEQARTHLENVKNELADNHCLADGYARTGSLSFRARATAVKLPNGVVIESFGTGQSLRGRRRGAHRPSLIICDDLQNDSHMHSESRRQSSSRWFQGTLLPAGNRNTNIVNLATALHRDALAMQLCRTAGWRSKVFCAIQRWPDNMKLWNQWEEIYCDLQQPDHLQRARQFFQKHREQMLAGAEVLWSDQEDLYQLMQMRADTGHASFAREKQNSPVDPALSEWPEHYFGQHIWFDDWPDDIHFKTVALDPSKGNDASHGDYSAFVVVGVDSRGVHYVQANMARRPTPQIVADGVKLCRRHQPSAFGVEANQFQELLAEEFVRAFAEAGITACTPCAMHNYRNKNMRIRRLGPLLAQRRLRFLADCPDTRMLVEQLRDFPSGSHDDGPDALEMAVRLSAEIQQGHFHNDGLGSRLPVGD